jgi:hypothetical protein
MPKISTYQTVTPQGDDTIIISQANGSPTDATKNITVNSLINLVQEEAGMPYIDTEISSAQLLDLHNTPVELIPAQGASTVILVGTMVAKYTFGTTAYSQSGNNNISTFVRYPVGGGTSAAQGFFNLDTTQDRYQISPADLRIDTTEAIANNEVNLTVSSPITGGDGTIKIRTYYSVLPSTF